MNVLTFLRFLPVNCSLTGGTIPATSIVGTASSLKNFMLRDFANIRFILKYESSKWVEHSTDVLEAWKLGLCFVDTIYRFPSSLGSVSSLGNRCIDIPSVCWLLAQLTRFGPPAKQLLPSRGSLSLLILYAMLSIGTRFYVTHSKHGGQKVRTGSVKNRNFGRL